LPLKKVIISKQVNTKREGHDGDEADNYDFSEQADLKAALHDDKGVRARIELPNDSSDCKKNLVLLT
jgi:hypothetical protein